MITMPLQNRNHPFCPKNKARMEKWRALSSTSTCSTQASRGRGRIRNTEVRNNVGRKKAPPSRFLWVGNLSETVTEDVLINLFAQFGELERVSLQTGRNFAFIDFKYEEAAFAAIRDLQGFVLAGSPLVVEFTKVSRCK